MAGSVCILLKLMVTGWISFVMKSVTFSESSWEIGPKVYRDTGFRDWYRFEAMQFWRNSKESLDRS